MTYDSWKSRNPDDFNSDLEDEIYRKDKRIAYLESVLQECEEYFDQRADIANEHDEDGSPRPNEAMKMLQIVRSAL